MNQQFYGWKLLAGLWVILIFVTGFASYGGNIMNTYMITEMHLDRKSLGLATGSLAFFMGLSSPLAGFCVHRWGARVTISAGTLMVALGALAMATIVNTLVGTMIVYGLVMGSAVSLGGTIPVQTLTAFWFRRRFAFALTIGITTGTYSSIYIASAIALDYTNRKQKKKLKPVVSEKASYETIDQGR